MIDSKLKLGVEVFFEDNLYQRYKRANIGLLTHQAATDLKLTLSLEHFYNSFRERLLWVFSPQHGLFSEKQANMIGSPDEREPLFGLPVKSLYGPRLKPEREDIQEIEILFVDLVDVGCRVYTYIWTLYLVMEICNQLEKEIVILDRPNPLGDTLEGPILERDYFSFVGLDSLPMRHGLTIGEIARLFQKRHFSNLHLKIIAMKNYIPSKLFPYYQRPWIFPSPNLPTFECALAYPGMVLLEGTNLSEGRGTTQPFLIFGAPFLKVKDLYFLLPELFPQQEWGVLLRPLAFEPTFDKWKGYRCLGFQIHITNPKKFSPVKFAIKLLRILRENHEEFQFLLPPYEFERTRRPIEILLGSRKVLLWLMGQEKEDLTVLLNDGLKGFLTEVSPLWIYEREPTPSL